MTKKTSIYVQSIEEREALLFPFEDIHWYSILYHKLTIALAPSPTLAPTLAFPSLWLILSYFLTLTHTQIQTYSHALFLLIGLVANT